MVTVSTLAKPCSRCSGSLYIDQEEEEYYLKCRGCSRSVRIKDFSGISEYGRTKLRDLFDTLKVSSWFAGVKKYRTKSSTPFIGDPVEKAIASTINLSNYVEVVQGVLGELVKGDQSKEDKVLIEYLADLKMIEKVLPALFIKLKEGEVTISDFKYKILSALNGQVEINSK